MATDKKSSILLMKKFVLRAETPAAGTVVSHLHVGQAITSEPSSSKPLRHCWQNVCRHGSTFGVLYVSRQTGHFSKCSESFSTSTDAMAPA